MIAEKKLEWSALEYEEKERDPDWFWALGVIIVAGAITSFIYNNYFFGLLLIVGGILLGFFAIRKPELIFYELNKKGLKIRDRVYLYKNIKFFWIKKHEEKTALLIMSERMFMPMISIQIDETISEEVRNFMLEGNVLEKEIKEHMSEKIMDSLGF